MPDVCLYQDFVTQKFSCCDKQGVRGFRGCRGLEGYVNMKSGFYADERLLT